MSLLVVSGTGTDVGKTITTAAVATLAWTRGERVAVVKPVQTGEPPGAPGDLAAVAALTGLDDLHELARYPDPLSPEAAARTAGRPPLDLRRAADHIAGLAENRDLVIVEGAGGLLVRYDPAGATIADLAAMLDAPVLVAVAAGLGTLNHTALTLEALTARKLACAGVVVGSWPDDPGLAELCNLADLEALAGRSVAGILPAGAARLAPGAFAEMASRSLAPALGGSLDVTAFRVAAARAGGRRGPQTIVDL
ncbi:MAG TPA: dethiobiotin synthase [Streptosporangiaceae bacterium]